MNEYLILKAELPNHVNGNHLQVCRWLDGCGWSIDVDGHHFENRIFEYLVSECLDCFKDYERISERCGYGLKGSKKKFIQKVKPNYFY